MLSWTCAQITTWNTSSLVQVKQQIPASFNKEKLSRGVQQPFEFLHRSSRDPECFQGDRCVRQSLRCPASVRSVSPRLSKPVLGPVLHLSWGSMDSGFHWGCFGRRWQRRFPPLFAPVCDGKSTLAPVVEAHPRQEVSGDMLGLDPRAGAHFSFPPLVEGHKPLPSSPVAPVDYWGIGVVAVLLEALPELTVICKYFLEEREGKVIFLLVN